MKVSSFRFSLALLAICAVGECVATQHEATVANVIGVLPVYSSSQKTIVAVPWVAVSTNDAAISVSNVLLTANLTVGDKVHVLQEAGSYNTWVLNEEKHWESVNQVKENAEVVETPAADTQRISRGAAFILERGTVKKDAGGEIIPFYLRGQVASGESSGFEYAIEAGEEQASAWNLIAAPSVVDQKINADGRWTGTINPQDRILLPTNGTFQVELKYDGGVWKYYGFPASEGAPPGAVLSKRWMEFTGSVVAGTGFWYVSKGGSPTVHWDGAPTVAASEGK